VTCEWGFEHGDLALDLGRGRAAAPNHSFNLTRWRFTNQGECLSVSLKDDSLKGWDFGDSPSNQTSCYLPTLLIDEPSGPILTLIQSLL